MTSFNEVANVTNSLNSLIGQLDRNFEIIIVDNLSTDGTYEKLREFEDPPRVKVIRRRCSRGIGRQVAFENASGEYIIANLDMDDIFLPVLHEVLAKYHSKVEGKLLAIFNSDLPPGSIFGWDQNITMGPRQLIRSIGGWRDLNTFEDWDIWSRAGKIHNYRWTSLRFAANVTQHPESKRALGRLAYRIENYRERVRLGLGLFDPGEKISVFQRFAAFAARISVAHHGALSGQGLEFDSHSPSLFVDLSGGSNGNSREIDIGQRGF